jgi:hypothetical protein
VLSGGAGSDWFWYHSGATADTLTNLTLGDVVTVV